MQLSIWLTQEKIQTHFVSSIHYLIDVVELSTSVSEINSAVAVGNEKGEVAVTTYDWQEFFTENKCMKDPKITNTAILSLINNGRKK